MSMIFIQWPRDRNSLLLPRCMVLELLSCNFVNVVARNVYCKIILECIYV